MSKLVGYILVYLARRLLMLDGDSLILLDVMKVVLLYVLSYYNNSLIRLIIFSFYYCTCIFFLLLVRDSWLLFTFYLVGCKIGLVGTCVFILNNMRLNEKDISMLIVIADPGIFVRIIRYYLCKINCIIEVINIQHLY